MKTLPFIRHIPALGTALLVTAATYAQDTPNEPKQSAAEAAGDPTAPLIQFQFQNTFVPRSYDGDGSANYLVFEPVIPIPKGKGSRFPQIARITFPLLATTPDPNRKTGVGDLTISDELIVKRSPKLSIGIGAIAVLPTASDDVLGQGKYQIGPSISLIGQTPNGWQIGFIIQDQISVAGDSDHPEVHQLGIQPILNYITGKWYFGIGDFTTTIDWKENGQITIPLAVQAGYVTKLGKYTYNFSVEPFKIVTHHGPSPDWGVRLGFVVMLPEPF
jgi:hypothetical protein